MDADFWVGNPFFLQNSLHRLISELLYAKLRNVAQSPQIISDCSFYPFMHIDWTLKTFSELTLDELYALLKLRNEVFIVEQVCPFPDLDGKDQLCHHLLGFSEESRSLVACTRIGPPGVFHDFASIGRVVTALDVRRFGVGRELMRRSIVAVEELYGPVPLQIGAQRYLKKFYESFGFRPLGEIYLEDGIEHIGMVRDV